MKGKNIHNLDTLEREIYRLKLEAKKQESRLDDNCGYLQKNFASLFMNSFFRKKKQEDHGDGHGFFKSEKLNSFVDKIMDRVSDRVTDGIDNLVNRVFRKKE